MQEHDHERKWYLAAKVLSGSILDAREQEEWETLKDDTTFRQEFELVQKYWSKMDTLPYGSIDTEKDWKIVWDKIRHHVQPGRRSTFAPWLRYAAVIAISMSVSFLIGWGISNDLFQGGKPLLTTVEAPPGSKTLVTLPDNSKIWLNAHSSVSYDENFGVDNRRLKLEGEAFFDVVKNSVPFVVQTDLYDISVLGTAFNVKTYRDDDKIVTTLVRGSLRIDHVDRSGSKKEVYLKPNEKLIVSRTPGSQDAALTFQVEKGIDAEMETAWKDGWLSVYGESLGELAKKIERMYDIKMIFEDKELGDYRYTGRIRQLSLEQVMKALALTSPVKFEISEKTVTLWENKSAKSKYRSLQTP
jgi:ferric-dicitrate binding protein FerR (iron transport regulator)